MVERVGLEPTKVTGTNWVTASGNCRYATTPNTRVLLKLHMDLKPCGRIRTFASGYLPSYDGLKLACRAPPTILRV